MDYFVLRGHHRNGFALSNSTPIVRSEAKRLMEVRDQPALQQNLYDFVVVAVQVHARLVDRLRYSVLLQLMPFPFPSQSMIKELSRFKNAKITWCQEEPRNQGGWFFVEPILEMILGHISHSSGRADYAGRQSAASPATGLAKQHIEQQGKLIDQALEI